MILKFDLTKASIQGNLSLLKAYKEEAALRVCLLIEVDGVFQTEACLLEGNDEEHIGFGIPSLEGTEIWIVPGSKKEKFEKTLGFAKSSEPLVRLTFENVQKFILKDPFGRGEWSPKWDSKKTEWGVHLSASKEAEWSAEMTNALKDHGTFAFPSKMGEA